MGRRILFTKFGDSFSGKSQVLVYDVSINTSKEAKRQLFWLPNHVLKTGIKAQIWPLKRLCVICVALLMCICLSGLGPEIHATRLAGGR